MTLTVRGSGLQPFGSLLGQLDRYLGGSFAGEFDSLARRSFGPIGAIDGQRGFVPRTDVVADGRDVVITVELPGIDADNDVNVEVTESKLTISGNRRSEQETKRDGVLLKEIRSGSFRREFPLPEGVGSDQVEADYDRGLLTVRVHDVKRQPVAAAKITVRGLPSADSESSTSES